MSKTKSPEQNSINHLRGSATVASSGDELVIQGELAQKCLDIAGVILVVINARQEVSYINKAGCRILECKQSEIIGKNWFDNFIPQGIREQLRSYFEKLKSGYMPATQPYENPVLTARGGEKLISWVNAVLKDDNGQVTGTLSSGEDVTERRAVERELAASKETAEKRAQEAEEGRWILKALMDNIPEGITIVDAPSVAVRMMSRYGKEVSGTERYGHEEMPPEQWRMYHPGGIRLAKPEELPLMRATRYGEVIINEEWMLQRPDGKMIFILANAGPIKDEKGKIVGGVIAWRDITERKQQQEKLKESYEKLQKTIGGIVDAITKIVETRDPYTAGHEKRVAELAAAIAVEMGFSGEQVDGIRMAATIHDIGKIYVPAEILSRPGRLSDMEFGIIKTHPAASYEILKVIDFPWPVAQIAFQHQERYNGSGYPLGLSGENILIEARILAVADVVEAMTFHRPYRPMVGTDKALEEIENNRGILYDPKAVDACLTLFRKKGFAFK